MLLIFFMMKRWEVVIKVIELYEGIIKVGCGSVSKNKYE
jgi:hypothetical protein